MGQFLSTHINRVDGKMRVSVPAAFRAVLGGGDTQKVVLFFSLNDPAIEGWPPERLAKLGESLDQLGQFTEDREAIMDWIYGEAQEVAIDREGRMVLPAELAQQAGISDQAAFLGRGPTFQIWAPDALAARKAAARERAKAAFARHDIRI